MIQFALVAFATTNLNSQSGVEIVPSEKCPFVIRDRNFDIFPQQNVIESRHDEKPGIYIVGTSSFDKQTYQRAKKTMADTAISVIVRRANKDKIECWNLSGDPIPSNQVHIPEQTLAVLRPGQIAVGIRQPIGPSQRSAEEYVFGRQGSIRAYGINFVETWMTLEVPKVDFVDAWIKIASEYWVGEIDPTPGSRATIDGVQFQVDHNTTPQGKSNWESRRVFQLDSKNPRQYLLGINFDFKSYETSNPSISESGGSTTSFIPAVNAKDVPAGATEIFVSSDTPSKYWRSLRIRRSLQMNGYLGHIPTGPKVDL